MANSLIDSALDLAGDSAKQAKKDWNDADTTGKKIKVAGDELIPLAADAVDKKIASNKVDNRSIFARSKNSVVQFPVYITQTIRVNEAHIISKLFERVYASLFQTILASNPIISNESEINNLVFLRNFHTNLKESVDLEIYNEFYTPIDDLDEMIKESVQNSFQITPTMSVEFHAVPTTNRMLITESERLSHEPLAGFTYLREDSDTLKSTEKETSVGFKTVPESEIEDMALERLKLGKEDLEILRSNRGDLDKNDIPRRKELDKDFVEEIDRVKKDIKDGKVKGIEYAGGRYRRKEVVSKEKTTSREKSVKDKEDIKAVDAPKMLRDVDIKKINGMLPYSIEATFRVKPKDGRESYQVHFIIGVKTNLHLIRTQDLMEDLRELVTGNVKSLQKVRYKTGEITFAQYLFNTSGIKADASKSINYNKKWLNTLKRLGEWEKTNGTLLKKPASLISAVNGEKGNVPIPNGTLVLAQTDVTMMMNQTGIDLSIVSNSKRLAKSLFLICVCIVDSSAGTMRVLFTDKDSDWDVQSLGAIDSELSKTDNSQLMRELNRMVNR